MSDVERLAKVFHALSSEMRIMLSMALLDGPKRLNELSKLLNADPSNLRKILLEMEEVGLVIREEGFWRATPMLVEMLSSISPIRSKKSYKTRTGYFYVLPSIFIFALAAIQAIVQGRPAWLLGGFILALIAAILGYAFTKRGITKP